MKAIIHGKIYNTETARYICGYINNSGNAGADLYQKRDGRYFLNILGVHEDAEGLYHGWKIKRVTCQIATWEQCNRCRIREEIDCPGISVREFCKKYMTPEEYQREFLSEKDTES